MNLISKGRAAGALFKKRPVQQATIAFMFLVFATCGCIASVCPGLIIDDETEQKTFRTITAAASSLLHGDIAGFNQLASYDQRYYGIGFYLIAYPLQAAIQPVLARHFQIDNETALLLARRPASFLLFAVATVIFYRCLRFQIPNKLVCAVFTAAFGLYPYVFGHAMINIKDGPFMSVYLLCTYLSLRLVKAQLKGVPLSGRQIVGLGIATAALASIRIPGLIIILQYVFTFSLTDLGKERTTPRIIRPSNVLLFCAVLFPLVVLAYPALWRNPTRELFSAMKFMGSLPQPGCTLTWGHCMPPVATMTYIAGWLVVKIPAVVLIGLGFAPFAWRKIRGDGFERICYLTFFFGSIYVLLVIVLVRSRLYDETRQILFIYPLLFLIAFTSMWIVARRFALFAIAISLCMFLWDQTRLHPYQYVYFNEFSRFLDIDNLFETDYWGTSAREHARRLQSDIHLRTNSTCLYADPFILYRSFMDPIICVEPLEAIGSSLRGPGAVAAITCSPNRIPVPEICHPISTITRSLPLSNRKLTMSAGYYCSY